MLIYINYFSIMKMFICAFGFVSLPFGGFTQINNASIPKVTIDATSFLTIPERTDTLPFYKNFDKRLPYNGMPNMITVKPIPPVYKGNNAKGFDIYESPMDNMPILVPDSEFQTKMPNPFSPPQKLVDSTTQLPNRIPGFLYKKKWQPNNNKLPNQ